MVRPRPEFGRDRPGARGILEVPALGHQWSEDRKLCKIRHRACHFGQELLLLLGEQRRDALLAGDDALDQALRHRHRERCRLHDALLARVRLDLEVAVLAPLLADLGRVDRPELDRAVVLVAHDAARAGDDACLEQVEPRRVEEIDVPLFVVLLRQAVAGHGRLDLLLRNSRLDLDRLGPFEQPCVPAHRAVLRVPSLPPSSVCAARFSQHARSQMRVVQGCLKLARS